MTEVPILPGLRQVHWDLVIVGLASKKLNLEMLIERRAQERRVVPESIARLPGV